jgi:hypothetical protein|tara:strand:+ start:615 stop:1163 length:549 start_codon:yes stop_codon:yes gene_type:complete
MEDIYDIVKNIEGIYDSNTSFQVLKDFERVLDELDLYVYDNWENGELAAGPKIDRHWVTCSFMWPRSQMPDPMGGKRLLDYDCKVFMGKEEVVKPRKIRNSGDIRPGSKKGKLDKHGIWLVTIKMPKKLIADIYSGTQDIQQQIDGAGPIPAEQPADGAAMSAPMDAAGAMTPEVTPMEPAI